MRMDRRSLQLRTEVSPWTRTLALGLTPIALAATVAAAPNPASSRGTPFEEPERYSSSHEAHASAQRALDAGATEEVDVSATPAPLPPDAKARVQRLQRFLAHARANTNAYRQDYRLGPHRSPVQRMAPYTPRPGDRDGPPAPGWNLSWTSYVGPWEMDEAAHLLHRTMVGPRIGEIHALDAMRGPKDATEQLLRKRTAPPPPAPWALEPFPDVADWSPFQIDSLYKVYWDRRDPLRLWWAQVMLDEPISARESMVLFWHDHFATSIEKVALPQSMYVQNQLFRRHAFGNFKTLVKAVTIDPAMLIWLDGIDNRYGHRNENYARELLEVFTIGHGNYTQDDVVNASKALTGWVTYDGLKGVFVQEYFDPRPKTFMGQTGNFNANDIVDIIFQQPETARYLCRKLYRWFIDEYPDDATIEELAAVLRASNYEVKPVLERMLRSNLFYDPTLRGSILCDGVDRSIGSLRALEVQGIDFPDDDGYGDYSPEADWTLFSLAVQGQMLLEPPDVGGWPGYRTWVNTTTLPWRKTLDEGLIDGEVDGWQIDMQTDVLELAQQYTDPNDAVGFVDEVALHLLGAPPTETVRARLLDELLQGAEPWEWSIYYPEAESRLENLFRLAVRLPDYQLK